MSNLSEAKEQLEQSKQLDQIINQVNQTRKVKPPRQKDIQIIEEMLEKKIRTKSQEIENEILTKSKARWQVETSAIHTKAVNLRQEIEQMAKAVELESLKAITIDINGTNYGSRYWKELPKSIAEAEKEDLLEINDKNTIPKIESIKREVEEFIINVRCGMDKLANVKGLIDKINQI